LSRVKERLPRVTVVVVLGEVAVIIEVENEMVKWARFSLREKAQRRKRQRGRN